MRSSNTGASMRFEGKTVLITGGAQGIGLACATRFASEGAVVGIVDRDPAGATAASAIDALFIEGDVAQKSVVDAAVARFIDHAGRIDILVNNAGITHAAEFLDLTEDAFDRVLAVNLKSYFLMGQAVARHMVATPMADGGERGAIINMSSVNAVLAIPNQVPYVVSKGGVQQLTKVMALSLASHGIRVNAIGPGTIATELAKQAVLSSAAARERVLSRTPMKRLGQTEGIAPV